MNPDSRKMGTPEGSFHLHAEMDIQKIFQRAQTGAVLLRPSLALRFSASIRSAKPHSASSAQLASFSQEY